MLLRWLRHFNRGFGVAVFSLYLALFAIAFLFMFIFPPLTLALLFLSIFGLLVFRALGLALKWLERRWNLKSIASGTCPACGAAALSQSPSVAACTQCGKCGARHDERGVWIKEPAGVERAEAA